MAFSVGIDLGTTNTVVSTGRRGANGGIEILTEKLPQLSEDGRKITYDTLLPSFLYIDQDEHKVGKVAKAMKSQDKNRVISSSKNYIGQKNYKWDINNKEYSPEIVASYFLSAIRNYLKENYEGDESVDSAVITIPASFDIDQRNATKLAAKLAGFNESKITLISEPTAAILDFVNEQSKIIDEDKTLDFSEFKNVLVFDLGGGTCDVAVLRIKIVNTKISVEEIAVSPHTLIGGTSFDIYAVEGIIADYEKQNKIKLEQTISEEELKDLKAKLIMTLEDIKIFFSDKYTMKKPKKEDVEKLLESINLDIMEPGIMNGKPFKFNLTMKRYNDYIERLFLKENKDSNIITPIDEALRMSDIDKSDIDYIFSVGGMSRYPKVFEALVNYFDKEPLKFIDSMESVSRGAAVYNYYEVESSVGSSNMTIVPKLPQTIFLGVKNGFPIPLIKANTKAGTPVIIEDSIKVSNDTEVMLEMYAGRSSFDPKLKKLQSVKMSFKHAVKPGSDITLKLEYTEKGIVNFNAWLKDNPEIKINISLEDSDLDSSEIEKMKNNYKIDEAKGVC